jgi:F-type H+-transporting ATPase subunit b
MAETTTAPKTGSHTEVPAEGHKQFPPFQADTIASQLFWFAVTFTLLYVMVSKLALPRVGGILSARSGRISGDLATADRLKKEADAALQDYEASLADARTRAQSVTSEMNETINAEAEKHRKSLDERLNAQLADAEKSIAATKSSAMANVRAIAVDAASAIVARLIGTSPSEPTVASAVDDVLKH